MGQAASAAFHSSVIVALHPPSLPVLNCPFLIFSASSIPEIVTTALSNRLNPSICRIRCFTLRWSLFHQIVQVLARSNLDATRKFAVFLHLSHRPVRSRIGVQRDLGGHASVLHCAAQKRFGGVHVPVPAEIEIDRFSRFVHGTVQVHPLPVNLYIGLVHPPRSAHGPSVAPPALFEFWKVALHPPQDRCMGHGDPPIRHHDHQLPQAGGKIQVKPTGLPTVRPSPTRRA